METEGGSVVEENDHETSQPNGAATDDEVDSPALSRCSSYTYNPADFPLACEIEEFMSPSFQWQASASASFASRSQSGGSTPREPRPDHPLESLTQMETAMAERNKQVELTKDRKKYKEFVNEDDRKSFLDELQLPENWLYADGEDVEDSNAYTAKLNELKALGDPIERRFQESSEKGQHNAPTSGRGTVQQHDSSPEWPGSDHLTAAPPTIYQDDIEFRDKQQQGVVDIQATETQLREKAAVNHELGREWEQPVRP